MSTMKAPKDGVAARPERTRVTDTGGPAPRPEPFADKIREVLAAIGEDARREGLLKTPERVESSLRFLTQGYWQTVEDVVGDAVFEETHQSMIMVRDIELYSLCEHHLLPFFGSAAVAYIPDGRVVGLSKIPRIVDMYARRLQIQERLTQQVADLLMERLRPLGVGVVIVATHLCAAMRGVAKPGMVMTTSAVLGLFRRNDKTRAEFFSHIARPAPRHP